MPTGIEASAAETAQWLAFRDWFLIQPGHRTCEECHAQPSDYVAHHPASNESTGGIFLESSCRALCAQCYRSICVLNPTHESWV